MVLEALGSRSTGFLFCSSPRLMLCNTFRNSCVLLLLGVRGKCTKVAFKGQPNWGMHALLAHSRKPEEIHQIVERLVGEGPFLELFARRPAPSATPWDIWGNECDASISLANWGYPVPADNIPAHVPVTAAETRS